MRKTNHTYLALSALLILASMLAIKAAIPILEDRAYAELWTDHRR